MFLLLRSVIRGNQLQEREKVLFSRDILPEMFSLSRQHDIAHLLAVGLDKNCLLKNSNAEIEGEIVKAIYRYEMQNNELNRIADTLENAKIQFIPLKGAVMRRFYPEPWMRTSCDIDILVHEEDADRVAKLLTLEFGYENKGKNSHDIQLVAPNKTHVELHYRLIEDGRANGANKVLENIWEMSKPRQNYEFWHEMNDEIFYFYHIAHMAKHFENGGCGIKPVMDLWILDEMEGANKIKRDDLLERGGLLKFAEQMRKLAKIWFENDQTDQLSQQVSDYILSGGVYGSATNMVAVQKQKKGNTFKYFMSRAILPYDEIKYHYPILQKHPILTPVMQVRRWFKLIFKGQTKRIVKEMGYSAKISKKQGKTLNAMLKNIGLLT